MAAQPVDPADHSARRLTRRFVLVLMAATAPILLALALLLWRGYHETRQEVLQQHETQQRLLRSGLEQIAGSARTHVAVMRAFAERRLAEAPRAAPYAGRIDWLGAPAPKTPPLGIVLGNPAALTLSDRQEAAAVVPMFSVAQAAHDSHPLLQWSYFFSAGRRLVAIYPWAPASGFLPREGTDAAFAAFFDYDLFTLGLPARNAARAPYWSPVYLDAGGAGLMVTHAAPVWVDDRFVGIVGTDILLSQVSVYLGSLPEAARGSFVVDQTGALIAQPGGVPISGDSPRRADDLLRGLAPDQIGPTFVPDGDRWIAAVPVEGTPWRLVTTIPGHEITAAVQTALWPLLGLLAAILGGMVLFGLLMRAQFVRPAVALARYGALSAQEAAEEGVPVVPTPWAELADRIGLAARGQLANIRQLRAMIDGIPLRAVYVDADFRYRDANREFLDFVGRKRADLLGRSVAEVLGPSVAAEYERLAPAIARGDVARYEGWIDFAGAGRRFLQVSILPFTAEGETRPGYLTFTRDLTSLKDAEDEAERSVEALRAREALYRSVVVSALDAIVMMDDRGDVVEFNPAAERIFGYTAAEAIGRPVADLMVPEAMRAAHRQGMERYLAEGNPRVIGRRVELQAIRKDGSVFPVELTVTDVSRGGRRLFVSHLRDLTEERALQHDMEQSRNRLHQVEKLSAMGSLLAGVAHELNNPLAVVVAQSALLHDKAPDTATALRAEKIRAAADRCGRIVKSFLAMARQKPPQRERLALGQVVRNALELVGYGLRTAGVDLRLDLPDDLPEIEGDRDMLGQVVSNIAINAQQALLSRPLPRILSLRARAAGGWVTLTVEDNGPGVPEAVRARIFDPYFTTKAVDVGTGIGLSISRNVIEAHGGQIKLADSGLGGAAFVISLPAAQAAARPAAGADTLAGAGGLSVLIVDDEPDVAASLAEILAGRGCRCQVAGSAAEAQAIVARGGIEAVFTDLRMPGIDGAQLIGALTRADPRLAGRIAVVTGDMVAGPAHLAAAALGAVPILEKPFDPADVAAVLGRLGP